MAEPPFCESTSIARIIPRSPIHIIDSCLLNALVCLTRDDLDPLPLVSRQFASLLSRPHFETAPLRLFHECKVNLGGEYSSLAVDVQLIDRHGRLFSHRRILSMGSIGDGVYGRPGRLDYRVLEIPSTEILEMLQGSPWLRAHTTVVDLRISDYQNPSQELAAQIAQGLSLTKLWSGFELEIKLWDNDWPPTEDPQKWPAGAEAVDVGLLAANCRKLKIQDHACFPPLLLVNWVTKFPCNIIELEWTDGSLGPKGIVDYLLIRTEGDERTKRKLNIDANIYSNTRGYLDELHVLIKEVRTRA